ncbi:hypothetical protein [Flavobacterium hungaricum]|uniref:Lipoprotein n=1 Tax=Flavobacterium hungaricum TaxID=2082725 RepID=A0ABR9TIU1_9FLAO|nr:hypothetical protein [Flavobacterium hungaricum]MBE8725211.1 hypothetical protein [Flavobacterium hungaricum]
MTISKRKKTQFFISISVTIVLMAVVFNLKRFHAQFYNKTGENLDSLVIAGTFIGNLKNGESTKNIDFKEFEFDGATPYEEISGNSNNKKLNMLHWSWCGTEIRQESNGSYNFDIKKKMDEKGNECLYLTEHNKKAFFEELK